MEVSPQDAIPSFCLSSAHTNLNSKGDAAVTPALSQRFSVFAPPAMSPDVKLLIKPRPIPLEHSELLAMFVISLFSLPRDSWIKLACSTWLFVGALLDSESRSRLCRDVKRWAYVQRLNQASERASSHGDGTGDNAARNQNRPRRWARNVAKRISYCGTTLVADNRGSRSWSVSPAASYAGTSPLNLICVCLLKSRRCLLLCSR